MIDSYTLFPPLHPSELDFRKDTCAGKCSECSKQSAKFYQIHYCVHAESSRLVFTSDSTTAYWKQTRRKSLGRRPEESKRLRSTIIITKPAEMNTKQDTFSELAERHRNSRESANTLPDRLHTGDITSQTDPNVLETAKHLYHKLLRKAQDHIERMPPQPCESSLQEGHTGQTTMSSPRDIEGKIVPSTRRTEQRDLVLQQRRWSRNPVLVPKRQATCFVLFLRHSYHRVKSWNKLQVTIFASNLSQLYLCTDLESGSTCSRSPS